VNDIVPVPDAVRALPSPRDISTALQAELVARVERERAVRGDVHQPEDVYALVRSVAAARELLQDYARAFSSAAALAGTVLEEEHLAAVGEQDGVPLAGLTVPDLDGTDIRFGLSTSNTHTIDTNQVIMTVINTLIQVTRDTEPSWPDDEDFDTYRDRYETWMAHVMRRVVGQVMELGSYTMQVSKVRALAAELAGGGFDAESAVVRGAISTSKNYRGVTVERKERKKR